jgi:opacity protein-like surface antigen
VYHGRETVDTRTYASGTTRPVRVESGFSAATLLQIEPEIGYQLTPRLSLSVLLRYQYAPAEGAAFVPTEGQKAILTSAFAGFARAQVWFGGGDRFQPYASVGAGGGRGFLAVIGKRCPPGQCGLDHSDTLHGGPVGLTAGLGLAYRFSPRFGLVLEVKEIMTLPKVMALTEFSLGFEIAHAFHAPAAAHAAHAEALVAAW